ncbi:hypothetical protein VM98_18885 [Streptomyces rubellomurinus subsp. indigoferus]|nr:hypothetical protein VM98_18885 [Streptomyces rubellomurinus subsp. indigoferus]
MALHREDVVRAALELLDEVGLDRLTTRALTDRLGVQRGALYWHVRSKGELLAAMAEAVMVEVFAEQPAVAPAASGRDWAEQTTAFAHRMRRALLTHRDGARLVSGHLAPGAAVLDAVEEGLSLMRAAGLPLATAAMFGHAVTSYVTGFVLQEQAEHGEAAPAPGLDPGRYPNLLQWEAERPADRDHAFAAGLAFLVRGLAADPG